MPKRYLLLTTMALTLLVSCGDKQPPTAPATDTSTGLDSGGLDPISPISSDNGGLTPIDSGTGSSDGFTPNDNIDPNAGGFVEQPPTEATPDPAASTSAAPSAEPTAEPTTEPSVEPTPEPTPAPTIPTDLTSSEVTASGFALTWTGVTDASGYNVYLDGTRVGDDVSSTSYTFSDLNPDTEYSVTVSALDADGAELAQSDPLSVTTSAIGAPTGLDYSDLTYNSLTLTWEGTDNANTYNVYLNDSLLKSGLTDTSYDITDLSPETDYDLEVSAVTSDGESPRSTVLSITTDTAPDPYGNERLGFLNTTTMEDIDGLDIKNGHAYMGYYKYENGFFSDTNERYIRDLNMATGQTLDTLVSAKNPGDTRIHVTGIAVNAAVVWAALDGFDNDGFNLYKFNVSGNRLNRYKVGTSGTIISDIAVDAASGWLYIGSRTSQSIIRYDEVNSENTQQYFSGSIKIDPLGMATDDSGNVYTFDGISRKVIKFSKADGSRLLEFGPKGMNNSGETYTAVSDLSVDPRNGDIYVTGNASGTVKIFRYDSSGNFIRSWTDGDLVDPRKLTVDADGKVYVIDASKKGVLAFSPGLTP